MKVLMAICLLASGLMACVSTEQDDQPDFSKAESALYYEWSNRSASTCGSWQYFVISVPQNTPNLTVASYGGSGTSIGWADLYVRNTYKPTTSSYNGISNAYLTNEETISLNNPTPGTWWIGLYANCSYTGVTVIASY